MTKKGKKKLLTSESGPNEENIRAHWTVVTKELFIDLAVEQVNIANRPGKGFNQKGWENIIAGFKSKTNLTYDQSQFKNLYDKLRASWQTWRSLIQNTGLGYDLDVKTFTMDNQRWDDMIKANPKIKEFRTKPLQFEDKLDALFLGNSAIGAMSWIPTSNASIPVTGSSIGSFSHAVDGNEVEGDAGESLNNEENAVVEEIKHLRKRKMAKIDENTPTRSKDGLKGELFNAVKVLTDMAVKIVDKNEAPKTVVSSSDKAIEDAIDILNNFDGVEVGSPFYYRCVVFLSDSGKSMAWLKMPPEARLGWLIHCVEKTN